MADSITIISPRESADRCEYNCREASLGLLTFASTMSVAPKAVVSLQELLATYLGCMIEQTADTVASKKTDGDNRVLQYFITALECGACIRCAFRYINIATASIFRTSYASLVQAITPIIGLGVKLVDPSACAACGGVLAGIANDSKSVSPTYLTVREWHRVCAAVAILSGWDVRSGISLAFGVDKDYMARFEHAFLHELMQSWRTKTSGDSLRLLKPVVDIKNCMRGMVNLALENSAFVEAPAVTAARNGLPAQSTRVISIADWSAQVFAEAEATNESVWVDLGTGYSDLAREGAEPNLAEDNYMILQQQQANIPPRDMQPVRLDPLSSFRLTFSVRDSGIAFMIERFPIFLCGRYCKTARGVAQTEWKIAGVRMGADTSVEEIIAGTMTASFTDFVDADVPDYTPLQLSKVVTPVGESFDGSEVVVEEEGVCSFASRAYLRAFTECIPAVYNGYGCWRLHSDESITLEPEEGDASPRAHLCADADAIRALVGHLRARLTRSPKSVFHTAGREDIDVRMLGPGRPCIVELVNVQRGILVPALSILALQNAVNAASNAAGDPVQLKHVAPALKEEFGRLQDGATGKRKRYAAVVWTLEPQTPATLQRFLVDRKDVILAQKTPMRVMHRRSLLVRKKIIHDMRVKYINPHYFILYLTTSAGAYVKEFVHGDLGRTRPNVGELLGCDADILQLDVVDLLYGEPGDDSDADEDAPESAEIAAKGDKDEDSKAKKARIDVG